MSPLTLWAQLKVTLKKTNHTVYYYLCYRFFFLCARFSLFKLACVFVQYLLNFAETSYENLSRLPFYNIFINKNYYINMHIEKITKHSCRIFFLYLAFINRFTTDFKNLVYLSYVIFIKFFGSYAVLLF